MVSFYFLSSAIIFLHEYFRNKYPNQYAQVAILVYYNLIWVYTHLQIFFKKSYDKLIIEYPEINDYIVMIREFIFPKPEECVLEFVKDGEIFYKVTRADFLNVNEITEQKLNPTHSNLSEKL